MSFVARTLGLGGALCAAVVLSGCASGPSGLALKTPKETLLLECPKVNGLNYVSYVGPYEGVENIIDLKYIAQDVYCSDQFKNEKFRNGFLTIYGSSRIPEEGKACSTSLKPEDYKACEEVRLANNQIFKDVKRFAYLWNKKHGHVYPVMTGAGPGLMLAGSAGAMQARDENPSLHSIGYTTYFDFPDTSGKCDNGTVPTKDKATCGNPNNAFVPYNGRIVQTDGLIFTSIVTREAAMIKHSAAIVLTPGGSGTEWESFQILETIKSKQLRDVPVFMLGAKTFHWKSLEDRIADMVKRGTLGNKALKYEIVEDPEELVRKLEASLFQAGR